MTSGSGTLTSRGSTWMHNTTVRVVIAVVALIVGLNVAAWVIRTTLGGPGGSPSSSYATTSEGFAAYSELLQRAGHDVSAQRVDLATDPPDTDETLVVMDANLPGDEGNVVRRFVAGGGTLIAGGQQSASWTEPVLDDPPAPSATGVTSATPSGDLLGEVATVTSSGLGSWSDPGGGEVALAGSGGILLTAHDVGSGRVWLLADSSPLKNELLDEADNAALGVALAGDVARDVRFLETVHGYSTETGLGAVPVNWRWALYAGGAAVLCYMWARGRRLGPPEQRSRDLPPPRREYVEALASTLARSRQPRDAVAPVVAAARARLCARAGLPPDADDGAIEAAARAQELPEDEIRALIVGVDNDYGVMAAGRALARLTGGAP
jgi:hypothetical protein